MRASVALVAAAAALVAFGLCGCSALSPEVGRENLPLCSPDADAPTPVDAACRVIDAGLD